MPSCNADGRHVLPPRYIGTAARPRCFQSGRYSSSHLLLIMDICEVHELDHQIPGLRIEFLPPRSTAKYQPLDLV